FEIILLLIGDIESGDAKYRVQDDARRAGQIIEKLQLGFDPADQTLEARPLGVDLGFVGIDRGNEIERKYVRRERSDFMPPRRLARRRQQGIFLKRRERLLSIAEDLQDLAPAEPGQRKIRVQRRRTIAGAQRPLVLSDQGEGISEI